MDHDIIIAGSGLVGASLALALGRAGLRVAVVEPEAPRPLPDPQRWDSRIYAISPGSIDLLAKRPRLSQSLALSKRSWGSANSRCAGWRPPLGSGAWSVWPGT